MKIIEIVISKFLVYLSFIFTYPLRVKKNRVSIISYFSADLGLEFSNLVFELEKNNIEIKTSLNHFKATPLGKLKYLFSFMYQVYLFNTSSVVVLDGNSYVYASIKTKKKVKTFQVWHALGAIKKFGMDVNRRYKIKGYDYLIVSSNKFSKTFSSSLNTELKNIHALGNLKSDYLFDERYLKNEMELFYQKYPELKDKKIVLYAPTFRGEGIEDMNYHDSNIEQLQERLGDEYRVLVKLHPLIVNEDASYYDVSKLSLYQLLSVSEYVVSDYSALIFDAMVLNKKIILYLYDYQQYEKDRGFSIDPLDFQMSTAFDIYELCDIITEENINHNYNEIRREYLSKIDGESTKRISREILKIVKGDIENEN